MYFTVRKEWATSQVTQNAEKGAKRKNGKKPIHAEEYNLKKCSALFCGLKLIMSPYRFVYLF